MEKKPGTVKRYGFWKCDFCKSENSGKFKKCTRCGAAVPAPRPNQISVYYLKADSPVLDEPTEEALKHAGPDWICEHCSSSNSDFLKDCASCGNPREETDKTRRKVTYKPGQKVPSTYEETFVQPVISKWPLKRILKWAGLSFVGFWVFIFLVGLCSGPNIIEVDMKLESKYWKRTVPIEKYKTVREGDWSLPAGGREVSRSQKIHHYDHVFDHYETKQVQRSRSVPDGTESYTTTHDNGDGTFSEETHTRTTYRTEYYTEDVQEAVYRDDPVYQTWIDYDIEKWVFERAYDTVGISEPFIWPVFKCDSSAKERLGTKYTNLYFKFISSNPELKWDITYEGNDSLWKALKPGDPVRLVVDRDSTIKKILPRKP